MERANAHFVECSPGPVSGGGIAKPITKFIYKNLVGEYPTLLELTSAEIPTAPSEPSVTAATTAVTNATELQAMSGAGKYYLTGNINLTGVTWTPITNFSGVLDGRGFTISNLSITAATTDYRALFGTALGGTQIYDLTISGFVISGRDYTSCLIGELTGGSCVLKDIDFTSCTLTGRQYVGSLVGNVLNSDGDNIYNCSVVGGTITGSIINGQVKYVGGLIGKINAETDATSQSNIVNSDVDDTTTVTWTGGATGPTASISIGGFAGEILGDLNNPADKYLIIHTCYSKAELTFATNRSTNIGGFAGMIDKVVEIVSCYSTGGITTSLAGTVLYAIGGFVGDESTFATYINCYSTGTVTLSGTSVTSVGGFIGYYDFTTRSYLLRCWSTSEINIPSPCTNVGGFIGSAQGQNQTEGPVGTGCLIERCWSTGDILLSTSSSAKYVGGFLGQHYDGSPVAQAATIQNCYSWGSITIDNPTKLSYVGGFIGLILANTGTKLTLTNCYDAQTDTAVGSGYSGQIPNSSLAGGLVGDDYFTTTINTATYWDTETSDIIVSDGGVGHITLWMQTKSNYQAVGWDFTTIWVLNTHEV